MGFGVRLDAGTAYGGAVITPYYDSLLVKVTAWAPTAKESVQRMDRALREFRIRGVASNLQFLENVINHPDFASGAMTTRFIDTTTDLLAFAKRRDRGSKLLGFLGNITVNGNLEMAGRKMPKLPFPKPVLPRVDLSEPIPPGSRGRLKALGSKQFAQWMLEHKPVLMTDTTMRILPRKPEPIALTFSRACSRTVNSRRVSCRNTAPAAVSRVPLRSRSKSSPPHSSSSSLIARDRGGCSICRRSAARVKCNSSAKTIKQRRCRNSICDAPDPGVLHKPSHVL